MTAALPLPAMVPGQTGRDSSEILQRATADSIAHIRTELLRTFLEQMNEAQIPYCLLNGFQEYPEVIASDVDFMVQPEDAEANCAAAAGSCGTMWGAPGAGHPTRNRGVVLRAGEARGWGGGLPASGLHDRLPAGRATVAGGGTGAREAATVTRRFSCRQSQTSFCTT